MVNEEYTKMLRSMLDAESAKDSWIEVEEVDTKEDRGTWVIVYLDNVEDYSFKVPVAATAGEFEAEWVENELRDIYEEVE